MATTSSTAFYTSASSLVARVDRAMPASNSGALNGAGFSETIPTTVTDGLDEHYLMPIPCDRAHILRGLFLANGKMDTNTTPLLDADIVLRSVIGATTTNTVVYDASALTPFSVPGTAGRELLLSGPPKAGATAGWSVNAAANLIEATLPASQTGSTLVVPISGLAVGDTITGWKVSAQIESAGGAVTLDGDLRKLTNAAGDPVDASVGAITQVAVTADTAVAAAKTGLAEIVAFGESFYILLTGTTAASTDVRYLGASITVTTANGETALRWIQLETLIPAADRADLVFVVNTAAATPAAANLTVIPLVT